MIGAATKKLKRIHAMGGDVRQWLISPPKLRESVHRFGKFRIVPVDNSVVPPRGLALGRLTKAASGLPALVVQVIADYALPSVVDRQAFDLLTADSMLLHRAVVAVSSMIRFSRLAAVQAPLPAKYSLIHDPLEIFGSGPLPLSTLGYTQIGASAGFFFSWVEMRPGPMPANEDMDEKEDASDEHDCMDRISRFSPSLPLSVTHQPGSVQKRSTKSCEQLSGGRVWPKLLIYFCQLLVFPGQTWSCTGIALSTSPKQVACPLFRFHQSVLRRRCPALHPRS